MVTPVIRSSNNSAYPLVLAYALILLSLWMVDMGLLGRAGPIVSGDNNVVATRFAAIKPPDELRSYERLLVSMLEQADLTSPAARIGADDQNEEGVRRLAALALIVYVTGDGIRR